MATTQADGGPDAFSWMSFMGGLLGIALAVVAAFEVVRHTLLAHAAPGVTYAWRAAALVAAMAVWASVTMSRRLRSLSLVSERATAQAQLLDMTLDAIFVRDLEGVITYWNDGARRLYGWTAPDAIGRPASGLLSSTYPQPEDSILTEVRERGSWEGELTQTARDGSGRLVESRWAPERDGHGHVIGILEVNRDITDRRGAELRFQRLLEAAPDAIVIVGDDGRIRLANQRVEDLFGYAADDLVGQTVEVLLPERFRDGHMGHRLDFAAMPRARQMGLGLELVARRHDGTEFPVEISLGPLETKEGILVSAAIRDITGRKEVERRLAVQADALASSNAELEQFAYVASHDLQEPLRKVASFCRLLQRNYGGRLDEKADTYIEYAVDGAVRMQDLINDLLDFSRLGRRELAPEPTDTRAVASRAVRNLDASIEEAGATVEVGDLPVVRAEPAHLTQLFQNLIGNAVKFRAPERPMKVEVGARRDGDLWLFWVRDNGIGIEPQYAERIFVVFQRLHGREQYPGTGIGLAICRRVVERLGGTIWMESQPGEGSTFFWTLPTGDP